LWGRLTAVAPYDSGGKLPVSRFGSSPVAREAAVNLTATGAGARSAQRRQSMRRVIHNCLWFGVFPKIFLMDEHEIYDRWAWIAESQTWRGFEGFIKIFFRIFEENRGYISILGNMGNTQL
jgi:hypothetical protein